MAMFLQGLSAKLGIASGRDLAQACREHYSPRTGFILWVICEIAIAACDLAEVLGSAVALKLLFGLPLLAGVLITAMDVLIVLALQGRGFRLIEAFVVTLIASIAACFAYEIFFAQPLWREAAAGFIPHLEILRNKEMLYIAIGILGATVMPHNLYLHSSIVQTRRYERTPRGRREALRFAVALRHRPMLVYDIEHSLCVAPILDCYLTNAPTLAHGLGFAQRRRKSSMPLRMMSQ
jgi:manganese transport protein